MFAVTSKEEMCLLLCLHSLILVLQGQRSEAREHLEVMLTIQFKPVSSCVPTAS